MAVPATTRFTLSGDVFDPGRTTTVDLGGGINDTLNITNANGANLIVANAEMINGSANNDTIQLATGSTVTGGAGVDTITASAGADNFRFTQRGRSRRSAAEATASRISMPAAIRSISPE